MPAGVRGRRLRVHRVEWEKHFGPIPEGLTVVHACDQPPCWEIHHLMLGTHLANMVDRQRKRRQPAGERNGRALLTAEQVLEIRSLREQHSGPELARLYGVTVGCVHGVLSGENWRHLPFPPPIPKKSPRAQPPAPEPAPRASPFPPSDSQLDTEGPGRRCRKCGARIRGSIGLHFQSCKGVPS